jgi:hypothetical protein
MKITNLTMLAAIAAATIALPATAHADELVVCLVIG